MKKIVIVILVLSLYSCVDPFTLDSSEGSFLVVDGFISDQPGPYSVKLSKATALNVSDQLDRIESVTGASVTIFDSDGNSELLKELGKGLYQTQTFQGITGKSYHLEISTFDGDYATTPEPLIPTGDFSNLHFEFEPGNTNFLGIYIDTDLLPSQKSLSRWRWTGTFKIHTRPELIQTPVSQRTGTGIVTLLIPDPPLCSGYVSVNRQLQQVGECTCCDCWVSQYSDPILSDPKTIVNNHINRFKIGSVEINRRTFYEKYYLEVEQLSVSQEAYSFWKNVQAQEKSGSDLFQTPPPKTSGNVYSKTAGAPKAYGLFAAYAISTHALQIDRSQIPYPLPAIDTIKSVCSSVYRNSTTLKPSFW